MTDDDGLPEQSDAATVEDVSAVDITSEALVQQSTERQSDATGQTFPIWRHDSVRYPIGYRFVICFRNKKPYAYFVTI